MANESDKQTERQKYADLYRRKEYDAVIVGDGVTDDYRAVQARLDVDGYVKFDTPKILISQTLEMPSHSRIEGIGSGLETTIRIPAMPIIDGQKPQGKISDLRIG